MNKGYYILEPIKFAAIAGVPRLFEFDIALYHWLIQELKKTLKSQLDHVELEIIRVTYLGSYPAIGIHYKRHSINKPVHELVERAINEILRERSAGDLIDHICQHAKTWPKLLTEIMNSE